MTTTPTLAPELRISQWFNTPLQISLKSLRGRVVVLHVFQMLCPGCVAHGIPQAQAVHAAFPEAEVSVIGLHSVFEHHEAMAPHALQAFIHEYRIAFPVAVDAVQDGSAIPQTMQAYGLRGTPSLIVLDHEGNIRLHQFGRVEDLRLGALIGQLCAEASASRVACQIDGCRLPNT